MIIETRPAVEAGSVWTSDAATGTLMHEDGYGFELSRFRTLEDLGFWVRHIAGKSWGTSAVLQSLVFAFDDINWDMP